MTTLTKTEELEYRLKSMTFQRDLLIQVMRKIKDRAWNYGNFSPHKADDTKIIRTLLIASRDAHYDTYSQITKLVDKYEGVELTADENGNVINLPAQLAESEASDG